MNTQQQDMAAWEQWVREEAPDSARNIFLAGRRTQREKIAELVNGLASHTSDNNAPDAIVVSLSGLNRLRRAVGLES